MSHKVIPALFAIFLSSTAAQAAPVPAPVAMLLQQIKGEWVFLDRNSLTTRLNLKADGSGQWSDYDGTAPISWRLDGTAIRIQLLEPLSYSWIEYENDQQYPVVSTLQNATLEFKKLEGLGTIIWKLTYQSQITYPESPDKASWDDVRVSDSVKLVASRQFKKFAPAVGQTLTLDLPVYPYTDDQGEKEETVAVLARLDSANRLTLVRSPEIGQETLFWALDNGSLRVSDGKGYTVSYRLFKGDALSAHVLSEVQSKDRTFIVDQEVVYSNEVLRTEGFRADSPLFQGCWSAFKAQSDYCFSPNRVFSLTSRYPDSEAYTIYGLWRLEAGRIHVDRFQDRVGKSLSDPAAMLNCEKELADDSIVEKTCRKQSSRSYELVNQDKDTIGVYRVLNQDYFTNYTAHVFERIKQ